jgi:hypothetical protein
MASEWPSSRSESYELRQITFNFDNTRRSSKRSLYFPPDPRFSASEKTAVPSVAYIDEGDYGRSITALPDARAMDIDSTAGSEDKIEYPGPLKVFFITVALCLAVFLVALVRELLTPFTYG